jgi:pyruvate carboxylase
MIAKLLVANRGEIAIRVLRAASELKIRTVAVYTYEDRYALHRYKADEAYQIGRNNDPLKPYLNIEEIIQVAKREKADAIHPGYGFLSENATFARRCREEGILFVGPRPETMERLGDKMSAKEVAVKAGIPVIEDSREPLVDISVAKSEAGRIGYPLIIKATAGGGGRGMRVIYSEEELEKAFYEARNEAGSAFGNDTLFFEKFVESPKHIEVQILADNHGNVVHLYERDCSVQRRFQKVVEVAPSTGLRKDTLNSLYEYALRITRRVGYNNAGTVEFLVDREQNIYFIEVNPRVQVEHTITEEVTGIDIVRSQLLIAQGVPLTDPRIGISSQNDIQVQGYAIQCRITTEDPANDFKPDFGTIIAYRNAGGHGIRLDEGSTYAGVKISPFFDSMLVKISSKGTSLESACWRMLRCLGEFRIRGVKTNIEFLENVISHPVFQAGESTVSFISENPSLLEFVRKQDRGTKLLKYLADIAVNGNPDISTVNPHVRFRVPTVPEFDKNDTFPVGTKNRLEKYGREGFLQWLKDEKCIQYTDTTFRDAQQSLLATRVRTYDMMKVAESFAKNHPEVFSMEVWGGATFDASLRFLRECPWERLEQLRKAVPNILLQMLIRGSNAVGYTAYPDNLVEKFIEKSAGAGMDIFRIFDSLNWVESMKTSIRAVRERTSSIAEVCICYTGDILDPERNRKYNLNYYLDLAKEIEDAGAHVLCIKDMTGLLKPRSAEVLISALKEAISLPIHLHTHDTPSIQSATYLKAVEAGVDVIDVALGSMSGLTSQPNFNSVVAMLKGHERELPVHLPSLNAFSNYWEDVREYYYPFESGLKAGTAEVYENEIPGGQYSNLRPQARALGLEDKFETIKKNYLLVNQMFGDIIKVTPSSKVVGDMALFMTSNNYTVDDIYRKGMEISFPDSVKSLFRGDLGQMPGGFPKLLQQLVLKEEQPYTCLPNVHLKPVDFDYEFSEFCRKFRHCTFFDFLSYKFYPRVFEEYYQFCEEYGNVSQLPTPVFFFGLRNNEEVLVEIDRGKTIMIKLQNISDPDEEGMRTVFFKLNGQTRAIEIKDRKVVSRKKSNKKVSRETEIGAPLQGNLSRIFVKAGDFVQKNTPLFTIEAMKMESTIIAPRQGRVMHIHLTENSLIEQDDVVIEFGEN